MTSFVVTIPGTLLEPLSEEARSVLTEALRPADPQATGAMAGEELEPLSLDSEESRFTVHLEVEAGSSAAAGEEARRIASGALEKAGLTLGAAPLGTPVITGIDAG